MYKPELNTLLIDVHNTHDENHVYIKFETDLWFTDIWNLCKGIINKYKREVPEFNTYEDVALDYFMHGIRTSFNNDVFIKEKSLDGVNYIIDLLFDFTAIEMIVYNTVNYKQGIESYRDRYIFNIKNEGNCIDNFIQRGIESRLKIINELIDSIKSRVNDRQFTTEYHNTWCYEKDYTQISLLKKQAEKIVENCATQLERISEKYTKLS